jgi:hypothetical protein
MALGVHWINQKTGRWRFLHRNLSATCLKALPERPNLSRLFGRFLELPIGLPAPAGQRRPETALLSSPSNSGQPSGLVLVEPCLLLGQTPWSKASPALWLTSLSLWTIFSLPSVSSSLRTHAWFPWLQLSHILSFIPSSH